jgi:hypothetical protein
LFWASDEPKISAEKFSHAKSRRHKGLSLVWTCKGLPEKLYGLDGMLFQIQKRFRLISYRKIQRALMAPPRLPMNLEFRQKGFARQVAKTQRFRSGMGAVGLVWRFLCTGVHSLSKTDQILADLTSENTARTLCDSASLRAIKFSVLSWVHSSINELSSARWSLCVTYNFLYHPRFIALLTVRLGSDR